MRSSKKQECNSLKQIVQTLELLDYKPNINSEFFTGIYQYSQKNHNRKNKKGNHSK